MNIFFLDNKPGLMAKYHCDKHVVKMVLETAQLLCSVYYECSPVIPPYKKTHVNHPCAIWARQSIENFILLLDIGFELCYEYEFRYGKVHKSESVIDWCFNNRFAINLPSLGVTERHLCMPDKYKIENDVVASYRNYYSKGKAHILDYTKRERPSWL